VQSGDDLAHVELLAGSRATTTSRGRPRRARSAARDDPLLGGASAPAAELFGGGGAGAPLAALGAVLIASHEWGGLNALCGRTCVRRHAPTGPTAGCSAAVGAAKDAPTTAPK